MQKLNESGGPRRARWVWMVALVVIVGVGVYWWRSGHKSTGTIPTFAARRGSLEITVLEGGSLQALESQEIKCEVRVGYQGTKILKIVEEGYLVTEEDVKTNKVLVELDSSELEKQIVQQEIQYQGAVASLTDAEQNYEIQLNQNASDIKTAEQKCRFARMDFDKFLGDTVTDDIIQHVGLDKLLAAALTNDVAQTVHAADSTGGKPPPPQAPGNRKGPPVSAQAINGTVALPAGATGVPLSVPVAKTTEVVPAKPPPAPAETKPPVILIDFSKYAKIEVLGDGEAKQKLRKFEDDWQVSQKEAGQATATLEGTRRLFDKGFVTRTDLQRDEIAAENNRLKVQTAETARELFLKYEFPKLAEESLSKYSESVRELDKARRLAISKLAQARARLNSAKGQHDVQLRQRNELKGQVEKCILRAKSAGLVVYGANRGDDMVFYGGEERIREGASVRELQTIITIPGTTRMAVNVKIHESYIKKVKKGLKARITVDAFPDEVLTGEVTKVSVLPDSQNRWMNPDMKVYVTTIAVDGMHDWVKPGMSAKTEILVNRLEDVVYIPVQAVSSDNGKQVCYLPGGYNPERREVEIGEFNDEFISVKSGLKEGECVLLRRPGSLETDNAPKDEKPGEKAPEKPEPAATAKANPKGGKV